CGSLPPGADGTLVTRLIATARAGGVRCAVDSSGEALAAAIEAGADLLSPNARELAGVSPAVAAALADGLEALADVATDFSADHGCELLVSLGADGAIWTDGTVALHARGRAAVPVNTAGAGDALLAGWLAGGSDPTQRLVRAVTWGRAACLSPTTVIGPGELDQDDGPTVEVSTSARGMRRSAADPSGHPPTGATAHA
ncbi:MAG: PfkB family carbohydrate kinase, partial [Kineosporiaceae bacterium]